MYGANGHWFGWIKLYAQRWEHTHIDRYGTPLFSVIFMVVSSHRDASSATRIVSISFYEHFANNFLFLFRFVENSVDPFEWTKAHHKLIESNTKQMKTPPKFSCKIPFPGQTATTAMNTSLWKLKLNKIIVFINNREKIMFGRPFISLSNMHETRSNSVTKMKLISSKMVACSH